MSAVTTTYALELEQRLLRFDLSKVKRQRFASLLCLHCADSRHHFKGARSVLGALPRRCGVSGVDAFAKCALCRLLEEDIECGAPAPREKHEVLVEPRLRVAQVPGKETKQTKSRHTTASNM